MTDFIFLGSKITVDFTCSHEKKKKMLAPWKESCDKPRQCIEKLRHHFADRGLYSQSYICPVIMYGWELDHKEGWVLKNWWFWFVVLGKTFESPLDCKEIKPANPKGNQPLIFIEWLMLKLKLQYFGHLIWRANSLEKTLMLQKTEVKRRRRETEDEMVR